MRMVQRKSQTAIRGWDRPLPAKQGPRATRDVLLVRRSIPGQRFLGTPKVLADRCFAQATWAANVQKIFGAPYLIIKLCEFGRNSHKLGP